MKIVTHPLQYPTIEIILTLEYTGSIHLSIDIIPQNFIFLSYFLTDERRKAELVK